MNKNLTLSQDEMQQLGYRVIDFIVDHFANLPRKPVLNVATPAELKALLDEVLPEQAADLNSIMDIVGEHIPGNISHSDHPRFFCFRPRSVQFRWRDEGPESEHTRHQGTHKHVLTRN